MELKLKKEKKPELTEEEQKAQNIAQIEQQGVDKFLHNLNLSALFQQDEETSLLTKIVPWIGAILSLITLIIVATKK